VIMAAAVADYRPAVRAEEKIKKSNQPLSLRLEKNPDIISEIGKVNKGRILVGFAMETQNLLANAREKLERKRLDFIVANSLREEGAGFQTDTNIITVMDREGHTESLPKMTKVEAAGKILDRIGNAIIQKGKARK